MMKKINFKHTDESLKKLLKSIFAYDLAVLYPNLDDDEKNRLLDLVSLDKLTDIFVELDVEDQLELLHRISITKRKSLLKNLETDDLKEFIEDIEESDRPEILGLLSQVKRKTIALLMNYDEDLAASIMSTDFVTIPIDTSIKEATHNIITTSKEQDYIDSIFVVDDEKRLVGILDLRTLIMARNTSTIEEIMLEDFQFVFEDQSIEKAVQTVMDYDRNSIPVLDKDDHIIGIVTADDIFDEIVESSEDDYQKLALVSDHDQSLSAFKRSQKRLPWLMIAVVLNLVIASFLSIFEATLAEVTALVLFQPLILGMAGNIGTQSLAVTILGIHLNEFDGKSIPKKHIIKEIFVGLTNSLLLATASFLFVTAFLTFLPVVVDTQLPIEIATVVWIAVFSSMFISALMGVLVPVILTKMKQDPSAAAGPIMTTINDVVALVIYFGVATIAFL